MSRSPARAKSKSPVEIRRNDDGSIDEVIMRNPQNVHIEQMTDAGWFIGVESANGDYHQFWLGAKNGRAHVAVRHTEHTPKGER